MAGISQKGMPEMTVKEINQREADGITVTLYAHFGETECEYVSCHVIDSRKGTDFVIDEVPCSKAVEVFNHPFAVGERLLMAGVI
jgi:hypothetical protein